MGSTLRRARPPGAALPPYGGPGAHPPARPPAEDVTASIAGDVGGVVEAS